MGFMSTDDYSLYYSFSVVHSGVEAIATVT